MVRKSLRPICRQIGKYHLHTGLPTIEYGMCHKHHLTKIRILRVDWEICQRCLPSSNHQRIPPPTPPRRPSQVSHHRQIPSFLLDTITNQE